MAWALCGGGWLALGCGAAPGCTAQGELAVERVEVREQQGRPGELGGPRFGSGGQLEWSDAAAAQPALCPPDWSALEQRMRLLEPRIDEGRCRGPAGEGPLRFVAGLGAPGAPGWRRELGFVSGEFRIEEQVLGASREGVLLSDLTVLDAATGAVLRPPPTHAVGASGRSVPDFSLTGAGLYLPSAQGFVWFTADVTLLRREGGLYFLDASRPGARPQLVVPVRSTLAGAHWRAEALALAPDGRHLLVAERLATRGPGPVALSAVALDGWQLAFQERFAAQSSNAELYLAVGPAGAFAFSYLDETAGRRVLVHYRLRPGDPTVR